MSRRATTVANLAKEADLDVQSVLVILWRHGISHVDTGASRLNDSERRRAVKLLDIAGAHQRKVAYWLDWLDVDRESFTALLAELGISLDTRSSTLPTGAIRRLKSYPSSQQVAPAPDPTAHPPTPVATVPAPIFPTGGINPSILFLSIDEVEAIHDALEEDFATSEDPIYPIGVRDRNLLRGAVDRPSARFAGQLKYPNITLAAAALLHGLVHNHPFQNGNKRTALVALLVFLDRNGRLVQSDERELFQWMLRVAAHHLLPTDRVYQSVADHEVLEIARWIDRNTRRIAKEERSVTWRVLRGVLRDHGCSVDRERGEKVRITRVVQEKSGRGLFRRSRDRRLVSHYVNTSDGREVPKAQVKRLRQELQLDDVHGIDSEQFYSAQRPADYFITEYSKTLKRLAKV